MNQKTIEQPQKTLKELVFEGPRPFKEAILTWEGVSEEDGDTLMSSQTYIALQKNTQYYTIAKSFIIQGKHSNLVTISGFNKPALVELKRLIEEALEYNEAETVPAASN